MDKRKYLKIIEHNFITFVSNNYIANGYMHDIATKKYCA